MLIRTCFCNPISPKPNCLSLSPNHLSLSCSSIELLRSIRNICSHLCRCSVFLVYERLAPLDLHRIRSRDPTTDFTLGFGGLFYHGFFGFGSTICPYKLLDGLNGSCWASWLSNENLALLIDDKDASSGRLGSFLKSNSRDEGCRRVAKQGIREILLGLECRIRFGRIKRESIDRETGGCQSFELITEKACLISA